MTCPECGAATKVLESRRADRGAALRRRRECRSCGRRFTTFERAVADPLDVIKRDGRRERFDRSKLRAALLRSTHKRQVGAGDVEALVERVEAEVAASGGSLAAERVGELCVDGLRELDYGAYLQFLGTLPGSPPNAEFAESAVPGSIR